MNSQRIRVLTTLSLVVLDAVLVAVAFSLAYWMRFTLALPAAPLNDIPFTQYIPLMLVQLVSVLVSLFFFQQYVIRRAISRVDQLYAVVGAVSIGTLLAVGGMEFLFKNTRYEV